MIAAIARLKGALGDPERAGLRSDRPQTHLSVGFLRQRVIGRNSAAAGQEVPKLLSFRSAGAARESGTHEHRTTSPLELQVFMGSGPAPAGRPGMTDVGRRQIFARPHSVIDLTLVNSIHPGTTETEMGDQV